MNNSPTTPLVSLAVVTYNSAPLIPDFFAALARITYTPREVLVIDTTHSGTLALEFWARLQSDAR